MHLWKVCAFGSEKCFKLAGAMPTIPVSLLLSECKMKRNVKENGRRGTVFCHSGALSTTESYLMKSVSNTFLLVDSPCAVYSSDETRVLECLNT
jgi:hypothetical protein